MINRTTQSALSISLTYALFGVLWIFFSDCLLALFTSDPQQLVTIETYKGWLFVAVSALLIYTLLHRELIRNKQAYWALAENKRKHDTLLSNLPGMVYRCHNDSDWTMIFVSDGCIELTGYQPDDLIDNHTIAYGQLIHPDDRVLVADHIAAALASHRPFQITSRIRSASGQEKWVWEQGCGVFSPTGDLIALEGFIIDVTAQQEAERELRQKRAELGAILQALPNALVFTDQDRHIRLVNPAFTRTFGYLPEEAFGQESALIYTSRQMYEEQGCERCNLNAQEEFLPYEVVYRRKNGTLFTAETVNTIVKDNQGKTIGFLGVIRDITQHKEAETALRNSEARYRALVEAIPDAMCRMSRDGVYLDVQAPVEFKLIVPFTQVIGKRITDVIGPLLGQKFLLNISRALETGQRQIFEYEIGHDIPVQVREVRVMPVGADEIIMILRDVTEQKRVEAVLEQHVEERTRQLSTLLEISHNLTSTLEIEPLLQRLLEQMVKVIPYEYGTIFRLEDNILVTIAHQGSQPGLALAHSPRLDLKRIDILRTVIEEQHPVWVRNIQELDAAPAIQREAQLTPEQFCLIRAFLGIPLMAKGRAIGMLVLIHTTPGYYQKEHVALAQAMGNHVGTIIENAQLYADTRRRLAEIESLQRVTSALLRSLTLGEIFDVICAEARNLSGADAAAIFLLQEGTWLQEIHAIGNYRTELGRLPVDGSFAGLAMRQIHPMFTNDPAHEPTSAPQNAALQSLLVHPLMVNRTVIGTLHTINKPGGFSNDDIPVLSVLADQAAIAIENARLHAHALEHAVLMERHRLARDLHDTVTQSIYSVILFADASRRALTAGKATVAADNLREARQLAGTALADMRLLLYELHPPEMAEDGLVGALHSRLDAVESRVGLHTDLNVSGELDLPLALESQLYKIAQEALNNVIKHAHAKSITIQIDCSDTKFCMAIQDDGVGFDPNKQQAEAGMGLRSINERLQQINGALSIQSAPGGGTILQVTVDRKPGENRNDVQSDTATHR